MDKLRSLAPAEIGHLRPLLDYVAETGGKRVRPAITLLASHSYPHDSEKLVLMAGAVELLHLATLIHDDTVDDSPTRRGRATIGNVWGHHVAVLFGDYVFATSATFVCDTDNIRIMRRFSETIMDLASGELIEYFGAFDAGQAPGALQTTGSTARRRLCSAPPESPGRCWPVPPRKRSRPCVAMATT